MRTVTNVYLLNLAVSDLLLGVFCMPFTLLGQLLKNFVFGAAMCKLIPYFQAVSVSVGVWTLVAISLERYFAICRPLKSRRWQTQFHAYKMIAVVWTASCLWNAPILVVSRLKAMQNTGRHKCREEWSSLGSERIYNLFLDAMLLLVPLLIMSLAYLLIVSKLWRGLRREIRHSSSCKQPVAMALGVPSPVSADVMDHMLPLHSHANGGAATRARRTGSPAGASGVLRPPTNGTTLADPSQLQRQLHQLQHMHLHTLEPESPLMHGQACNQAQDGEPLASAVGVPVCPLARHAIRSNYMDKSIEAKKKVIRMLFVVVAEFFVCWAPLHVLNTWYLFNPEQVYAWVGSTGVSLVQLMAYVSSCCNPITYCFMNRKFRQAFLGVFNCRSGCCPAASCRGGPPASRAGPQLSQLSQHSDQSPNDSTVYAGRGSAARSGGFVVVTGRNGTKMVELEDEARV
ncbi:cholecystokinin receptor type A-like [Thrips palmi]|uniref:Cholecystokinin receptor type A-like n=1 Tax=Thrips palmi TaxID=161013 RepID=A0A6P8YEC5_THRPL|nr:cholecystokinin receptor type A-like [Thrips palmi]